MVQFTLFKGQLLAEKSSVKKYGTTIKSAGHVLSCVHVTVLNCRVSFFPEWLGEIWKAIEDDCSWAEKSINLTQVMHITGN